MLNDSYLHQGLRKKLVSNLRKRLRRAGINDESILDAFWNIPRHYFVDDAFAQQVYQDKPFPIDCEQTISQPFTVAIQTYLLEVKKGQKILEVGTGSGFQAAVLHHLGAKVYSIERYEKLFKKTSKLLDDIGFGGVRTFHGDGMKGLESRAPFDRIIVTAGAQEIPESLKNQLNPEGGILIIPVGKNAQDMIKIIRRGENRFSMKKHGQFRFVPLIGGKT